MNQKELEKNIVSNFQQDEGMMILVFAQWCINEGLDPQSIYRLAYPEQPNNPLLAQMIDLTVSKEEAGEISNDMLLGVLSLYGNDELAYVVSQEIEKRKSL